MSRDRYDFLVVGAGFAGAVMAERLAADGGMRVLVIDRRAHVGGNAYDRLDRDGVLIHEYGPHIFHTNSASVLDYLSQFTAWRPYEHRVLGRVGEALLPMPINRTTLNRFYNLTLDDDAAAQALLARLGEKVAIVSAEDAVVAQVGRPLYEALFRGYSTKQWGADPTTLDRSVTARVPARCGDDDRYFTDRFQCMPAQGYTALFERLLDHARITVRTGTEYRDVLAKIAVRHTIFTGPIDDYFGRRFGPLPYRSLRFVHRHLDQAQFQPVGVVNYPDAGRPYTRITEYKHLTGQTHPGTSISYEYPCATGEPYYPVPNAANAALRQRYEELAEGDPDATFIGRLGTYRYLNMDQVVGQALAAYARLMRRGAPRAMAA